MKNLKLLLAFLAGVAITLLLTSKRIWNFDFNLPLTWNMDGGIGGTLALLTVILFGAYLSHRLGERTGENQKAAGGMFDFLKNLKTSETDCWLGGVCGGLGRSTPVPSWIWRLCFAVAFFYYGAGLLAYVLLWVFLPSGDATAETQADATGTTHRGFLAFLRHFKLSACDCWIGGVCGGLAEGTRTPSWVWRLLFTILFFCYGAGFLAYVLLWIFVPRGETKNQVAA